MNNHGGIAYRVALAWVWTMACAGDDAPADGGSVTGRDDTTSVGGTATTRSGPTQGEVDDATSLATEGSATSSTGTDAEDTGDDDTGVPSDCGNGSLEQGEACDEPDAEDADGCNEDCTVSGSILWSHVQATGFGAPDDLYAIALDAEGNAYVGGGVYVDADAGQEYWVRKYTADGALGWTSSTGGSALTTDAALGLAVSGNSVFVAGYLTVTDASNDWRITEYSLGGAPQWADNYANPVGSSDVARAIAADGTGGFYVAGHEVVLDQGHNIRIRQYLPDRTVGWESTVEGVGDHLALAIAVDVEGNVIAGGFYSPDGQGRDGWIRKFSPAGAPLWTNAYVGAAGLEDQVRGVATDAGGDIVAVGYETTAEQGRIAFVRRLDPDFNELWTQTWAGDTGEPVVALDVAIDSAGHIVVVGTQTVGGVLLGLIRKYDAAGEVRWSQTYATEAMTDQYISAVTTAPDNRIWVAGSRDLGIDGRDAWVARIAQ